MGTARTNRAYCLNRREKSLRVGTSMACEGGRVVVCGRVWEGGGLMVGTDTNQTLHLSCGPITSSGFAPGRRHAWRQATGARCDRTARLE